MSQGYTPGEPAEMGFGTRTGRAVLSTVTQPRVAVVSALPGAVVCTVEGPGTGQLSWSLRGHFASCLPVASCRAIRQPSSLLYNPQKEKWHLERIYSGGSCLRHENKAFELLHIN